MLSSPLNTAPSISLFDLMSQDTCTHERPYAELDLLFERGSLARRFGGTVAGAFWVQVVAELRVKAGKGGHQEAASHLEMVE